ncbi:transglutaminase family protein [Mucilaginibacter sp. UR6-11]|uniref:transglutaminase-like domain-containing protein n=1 Tax=Mucilaginibacter sp. UR6-11 TaxID=1435644 RepID=UPI001E63C1A2|nr:transglutaminase family protein [Mucilaginibacter sp. UR6-11]MCC8425582.1 transglutaminase family protein [Mucilaginibacter sp. UR6-11]
MKFDVFTEMEYKVKSASTLILNINALRTPHQTVLSEEFTISPYLKSEELVTVTGENRLVRLDIRQPGTYKVSYKATVDNCIKIVDYENHAEVPVSQFDPSIMPYLYPSRYCQSDKLYRLANNMFGNIVNPFTQVIALTDWIYRNVQYLSGSTNAQTSAFDTVTEQAGVCRDFAHLGIALCRALTIPARYFTGYAYQLKPADFHACFEAYLGGEWILFDATKLVPLNGMVKIATGRDAADTAIANIFGDAIFTSMIVSCELADEGFEPVMYGHIDYTGISYL